jgi:hypothetical protein
MIASMKLPAAAAAALLTLAACSGGGTSGGGGDSYSTGADLASAIGCTNYQGGSQEMYVADGGTCTLGSNDTVIVDTFSSQDNATNYADAAKASGGVYVIGKQWVVGIASQDEAKTVMNKIGGTIR